MYKFVPSGNAQYFEPFLKPTHSVYRNYRSQSEGTLLEVPHFASIYKNKKHFGSALFMMPQGFGMICLTMYAQSNLSSFRKKLKIYL